MIPWRVYVWLSLLAAAAAQGAGQLTVQSVEPAPRSLGAPLASPIRVHFDRPVMPGTVVPMESFWAFGRWSGSVTGTMSFSNGNQTVTLTPDRPLSAGESVMVLLSHDIQAADGSFLRDAGYSYQFWTRALPASLDYAELDRLTTRSEPGTPSRAYGGLGSDLDRDGFLDITIVNEDTDDLRVFLNTADGSGLFDPFLVPTFPTGPVPSPSEPSDFDRDGIVDVAVANTVGGSVSILLGQGDGTFGVQQEFAVGAQARGIAVLDVDGDGDTDVTVTSAENSTISVLSNDGKGVFGPPVSFGTGTDGEWALAAADMSQDGILDLVVGARSAELIYVYTGNGDGTFSEASFESSGGSVWMLVVGDVNGDRREDVAVVNSVSNNGAVLLGDGTGQLAPPQVTSTDPFPLATDLGDLDGDGDLDWVTSSFAGDWMLFANAGDGTFSLDQEFTASQAASCSLLMDLDSDGDLDLALIDELEDEVILMENPTGLFSDGFESGDTSAWSTTVP
jgi:hypothetical protein